MKKDITFTLPAEAVEGATEVLILGEFNNWTPAEEYKLEKQQDGSYKTIIPLEEGKTYQYRFLLNDGRWVNDYHAQSYVPVYDFFIDNCVITVPETSADDVNEQNTSAEPEQETQETVKKEKASKAKAEAKSEPSESTKPSESKSKKATTSKAAKAKPDTEKVKEKKSEKPEKPAKTSKKGTSKK